jgi:hypothetical protein
MAVHIQSSYSHSVRETLGSLVMENLETLQSLISNHSIPTQWRDEILGSLVMEKLEA